MSHFYATMKGDRGETTRCGTKTSGITTTTASYKGAIRVDFYEMGGKDYYSIKEIKWLGAGKEKIIVSCELIGNQE